MCQFFLFFFISFFLLYSIKIRRFSINLLFGFLLQFSTEFKDFLTKIQIITLFTKLLSIIYLTENVPKRKSNCNTMIIGSINDRLQVILLHEP